MRLISLTSLTDADRAAWKLLARSAAEPNPFYEPEFVLASAQAEGGEDVQIFHAESAGRWTGCLPVRRRRVALVPGLVGWRSPYSYLGTPLVAADALGDFAAALAQSLRDGEFGRFLFMRRLGRGPVEEAIERACRELGGVGELFKRVDGRAALVRRDQPDYLSGMKSRRRSELKRQRKKLQAELGTALVATERTDFARAIDDFLQLEASGWKGRGGTAMASREATRQLFRDLCSSFAAEGRLLVRSLQASERVAAMTCDIAAGDVLFGFKAAYDEDLRRYSPGIQLQIENFTSFHEVREELLLDSCGEPDNEPMNALWPDRRDVASILLGPTGPLGRIAGRGVTRAADARRRAQGKKASKPPSRPK